MTRRSLRRLGSILIGAMLYGQLAIAAYACPSLASPAVANVLASDPVAPSRVALDPGSPSGDMSDCSGMGMAMDASSANLCAGHCQFGQQSDQVPQFSVPAVLLTTLYVASPAPELSSALHPAAADLDALAAASPPHAILHCTFRI